MVRSPLMRMMSSSSSSSDSSKLKVNHKISLSSLPLAISLYYNCLFSIMFACVIGACSVYKNLYFNKKVSVSVIAFWCLIEPFRLYYGISGNMKEKVPDIATFLLITIFPQTPFILYFSYIQPVKFPVDPILGSFMLTFLVVEVIYAIQLVRVQIRSQTTQFMRLCEEE